MAPRSNAPSAPGEISLVHLKNCLVNLPVSLVGILENINTPAQNVIVELSYRAPAPPNGSSPGSTTSTQRSVYVGWTGMPSKRRATPVVDRDGIAGGRGGSGREKDVGLVEIDPTLANTLGLQDGQRITASLHIDPPTAHTVNIEPLTPEDWEIIELHATFLELNLLSQIRALPNPTYTSGPSGAPTQAHPLTLHLSPTSTANIKVLTLEPALPADAPFAKIAPDAEVIVAPKVRAKPSRSSRENRSVGSTSKKSAASTVKRKNSKDERKASLFLRAIDRKYCDEYFDDDNAIEDLAVWVDSDLLITKDFKGLNWVTVSVVRSLSAQAKPPAAGEPPGMESVSRVVAQLRKWDDPPNGQAVALSTPLAVALGYGGAVGGVIKIEPASPPLAQIAVQKTDPDSPGPPPSGVQKIKVYPFATAGSKQSGGAGLKFGGETKAEREEDAKRIRHIYEAKKSGGLLRGPLTDGMILGVYDGLNPPMGWSGAIIKLEPPPKSSQNKESANWVLASERRLPLEVQEPIPRPSWMAEAEAAQDSLPASDNVLVGIDTLWGNLRSHLSHMSSVLLTGALGCGKTSIARSLAQDLKENQFYHTTYFACRKLVNDETRISTIKEALNKVFLEASWGARLGGRALVVLDDLDRLCPVETELQTNENGRSRQISEAVCAVVRQYCGSDSNVVLLATAQGKDSLHNVIIGGHVVREIVALKAPDKEARRKILETIARKDAISSEDRFIRPSSDGSRPTTADGSAMSEDGAWMDGASQRSRGDSTSLSAGFLLEDDLDFLDIAGQTDGYMPGDLELLVSRARAEAHMRSVNESPLMGSGAVPFGRTDFDAALKGFTPASLRNVTLQHSTVSFSSIGGLRETRRILLETLEYPTKYAPIFAKCPLRLRSGLLLYGFPGCGKTLLASAVAGECGLNFISVKGPEILNKYIGASEKSVRDLFERAQAARPCVLFFDEFDSIAPKRGHDSTGVTDRVVNQLLTQMDGAEGLSGVYVLAATSRPDLIDPALLRPGRLDKSLLCGFPDAEDRIDIIRALASKAQVPKEVLEDEDNIRELARRTEGLTGADLQALVSNAQLEAIHDVLGDQGRSAPSVGGRHGNTSKKNAQSAQPRNFIKFRYGAEDTPGSANGTPVLSRQAELAEQNAIVAKLEGIKLARRREKALLKGGNRSGVEGDSQRAGGGDSGNDVVIAWKHIAKALEDTRASISVEERRRLERIYREFVVGRSGEMRDGQGSMEIGGRSSLM